MIDSCLDPDPELRPLASELEAVLMAHSRELTEVALPAVLRPEEVDPEGAARRVPAGLPRIATAFSVGGLVFTAMALAGGTTGPGFALLAAPLAGVLALGRPKAGFAVGAAVTVAWLGLGAGSPGAALVVALLCAPLALLPDSGRAGGRACREPRHCSA